MRILVACERSQKLTINLRSLGHAAFSCDILPCYGDKPEWHIEDDIVGWLYKDWDAVVAFPPCTHLASSGARWFAEKRKDGRQQRAIDFFMAFTKLTCKTAIENPIGVMSTVFRKPNQIIQPWQFGHGETKATCLWLNNLPKLIPTDVVTGREQRMWKLPPSKDRSMKRSETYDGIASAMAKQWFGGL